MDPITDDICLGVILNYRQDNESKRERFTRLIEARMRRLLKDIQLVGNLANRSNYDYDDGDIEYVMTEIQHALLKAKMRFDVGR